MISTERIEAMAAHALGFIPPSTESSRTPKNNSILWMKYGVLVLFRLLWPKNWSLPIRDSYFHSVAGGLIPCVRKDSNQDCPYCDAIDQARSRGAAPKVLSRYESKWMALAWIWLSDYEAPARQDGKEMIRARRNSPVLLVALGDLLTGVNDHINKETDPDDRARIIASLFEKDGHLLSAKIGGTTRPITRFEVTDQTLRIDSDTDSYESPDDLIASLCTDEIKRVALAKIQAVPTPVKHEPKESVAEPFHVEFSESDDQEESEDGVDSEISECEESEANNDDVDDRTE